MENRKEVYEAMKVAELKDECRARGLTLESKGKKFNKTELIQNLLKDDEGYQAIAEEDDKFYRKKEQNKETETKKDGYISFAKTLDEIKKKYSARKKQSVYDNELKVGSMVVFIHYVEAANGGIYEKLRTAKVVGVNRKKELIRVTTLLGTDKQITFDDILYVRGTDSCCSYPRDISEYLKKQRTEKGRKIINEKFAEGIIAD